MGTDRRLVVIVGATGLGKTDLSLKLARHFCSPIVSTDSRQVYRGIPIGTAQPAREELQEVEHHFIASCDLTEDFNCGRFEAEALALLDRLFERHDTVIAVGGSGLYVRALCEGMDDLPQADARVRAELSLRLEREGLEALAEELRRLDPVYAEQVDRSNPARVLRALEVCIVSRRPYSELRSGGKKPRNFSIVKIGITLDRAELYRRIDRRVEQMMAQGLEAEARAVYPLRGLNSLQTVGYRELFDYFDGKTTLAQAVELIKRNTRRYAKRQLTWFRADKEIRWFAPDDTEAMIRCVDFCNC